MALKATLHMEILLHCPVTKPNVVRDICAAACDLVRQEYAQVKVGLRITDFDSPQLNKLVEHVTVADYTGPKQASAYHRVDEVELDAQSYSLMSDDEPSTRRRIHQDDEEGPQARTISLPNIALKDEWDSLIYDEALPSQLLRYLTRMLGVMKQPGLNLSTFNWNRLCLLHGPPGSGKSTLCRALAQKLSIRLNRAFPHATLVEVNTNSMLSKYFGESGRLIGALFEKIYGFAQNPSTLVCVVMDEVETIAGSREKVTSGGECSDGMRATNQLLTALDRIRNLPNVIVLCTSNLINAIDPAVLDRVDIKSYIPTPSPAAIYEIFRSCLNELVRSGLIDTTAKSVSSDSAVGTKGSLTPKGSKRRAVAQASESRQDERSSSPLSDGLSQENAAEEWTDVPAATTIPTYAETKITLKDRPDSPGWRVWILAQKCEGFSGRTLRRLPILGLAMYTWGGDCSMQDAIMALEAAVEQELKAKQADSH